MLQIVNISEARSNLAKLIKKVKETKEPIIIVQDSSPSVVLFPYEEVLKNEQKKQQIYALQLNRFLAEGKKLGKRFLNENNAISPLSEDEAYTLIKNA